MPKAKKARTIESYHHTAPAPKDGEHVCTPEACPPTGGYYVTCIGDTPGQWWPMAGPYDTHAEALALVNTARAIGEKNNPRAIWYSWGTVRMKDDYRKPGRMNAAGCI